MCSFGKRRPFWLLPTADLDPTYGTFVFHTVEGRSKCPCETGTNCIEDPSISVVGYQEIVPNDEVMIFVSNRPRAFYNILCRAHFKLKRNINMHIIVSKDVEIANKGYGESTFFLYSEKLENNAGLSISIVSCIYFLIPHVYHLTNNTIPHS